MLNLDTLTRLLDSYTNVTAVKDGDHTIRLTVLAPHNLITGAYRTYRAQVDLTSLFIHAEGNLLKFWDGKGHGHAAHEIIRLVAFQ